MLIEMGREEIIKQEMILLAPSSKSDRDEEGAVVHEVPPPTWTGVHQLSGITSLTGNRKRLLSKQLSMRETTREAKWEKRRRQIIGRRLMMERGGGSSSILGSLAEEESNKEVVRDRMERRQFGKMRSLTDEDLDELRGSIDLGFGFSEGKGGHRLCKTLPALDLYFAVNRQLSDPKLRGSCSPTLTPSPLSSSSNLCGTPSPRSPTHEESRHSISSTDSWILNPGDNPQAVKMRLRHWAQAVACSVKQLC